MDLREVVTTGTGTDEASSPQDQPPSTTIGRLPETSANCPLCEGTKLMIDPDTMKAV